MTDIWASVLPDSIIAVMALVLAVMFWKRGTKQFKWHFVVLSLLVASLAISYMCELFCSQLSEKLFCNDIEYVSITGIPILYLLIVVKYAGREDLLTRKNIMLITIIPLIDLIMVWTNGFHHLFYGDLSLDLITSQPYSALKGPFYYLHIAYSFGLEIAAIGVAAMAFIRSPKVQRAQVGLILLSAMVPTTIIVLSLGHIISTPIVDAILLGFLFSGVFLYLAVYRCGLFYATPLVLNSIADIMQDGAVMVNNEGQITYLNSAAKKFIPKEKGYPLGRQFHEVLPEVQAVISNEAEGSGIVEMMGPLERLIRNEVRCSPVFVERKNLGQLLVLRDITSQRHTEEALASSNSKLNVLYGVTRHDILNRINVIRGYGELLKDKTEGCSQSGEFLKKMLDSTVAIEHIINFTKDYEKVGGASPEWQNVGYVYHKAKVLCAEQGVEYIIDTGALEIYADPMLERLFYILLDNTYRHGSRLTRVQLTAARSGDDYHIIYEDDGVGVPSEDKGRIFQKGFGSGSGLGLYLGRQILSITGIAISENGVPLKGARFEICVPKGKWRTSGSDDR
jgi:signal transduction histidine kinase